MNQADPISNSVTGRLKEISFDELLKLFDVHTDLGQLLHEHTYIELLNARNESEALVIYENLTLDSSQLGRRTALRVGEKNTYKTVAGAAKIHIHDLPSQRQYPVYWCRALQFRPETLGDSGDSNVAQKTEAR